MRHRFCVSVAVLLSVANVVAAQGIPAHLTQPPPPPPPVFPGVTLVGDQERPDEPPPVVVASPAPEPAGPIRFWLRADYLGWWVKDAPLPVSLVTTGDPNNNPGAELLNSSRHFDGLSGMRLGLGVWFDDDNNIGLENFYFFLGRRTRNDFFASDNTGNPTLAYPFINQTPGAGGGTFVLQISSPGQATGNALISNSFEMWGAEINAAFCLYRTPNFEFTVLAGFRYLDLQENLNISNVTSDITTRPHTVTILDDNFNTRNQFYGGQIASRFSWRTTGMSLDVTGKLAMGSTHEIVDIQGYSTQFGPGGPTGTFNGGFFAQPSNIGRFSANQFAVVPSVEAKWSIHLSHGFRIFVGYDFLYWNQVVRPGNQIDRNINLSQSAILGNGALAGPSVPGPLFQRTDFWAHGISVGIELRF